MGMKTILTVKQVAELPQVSIPQVRRMIANGELSAMKVGREWRVPKAALEELFERELLCQGLFVLSLTITKKDVLYKRVNHFSYGISDIPGSVR